MQERDYGYMPARSIFCLSHIWVEADIPLCKIVPKLETQRLQTESDREKQQQKLELARITAQLSPSRRSSQLTAENYDDDYEQSRDNTVTQLSGKGVQVFVQIYENEAADYDKLKKRLLTAYESVPAVYCDNFRSLQKNGTETFSEFAFSLEKHFRRWITSLETHSFEKVCEVMLIEQFLTSVDDELRL